MTQRSIKKSKLGPQAYGVWRDEQVTESEGGLVDGIAIELAKAEPDLLIFKEPYMPPELEAAIEVINDGGLQELTPMQQRVFQLSIVEGRTNQAVGEMLGIERSGVRDHLELIGKKLKKLCDERM